jgi:hypothetical protein
MCISEGNDMRRFFRRPFIHVKLTGQPSAGKELGHHYDIVTEEKRYGFVKKKDGVWRIEWNKITVLADCKGLLVRLYFSTQAGTVCVHAPMVRGGRF